MQTGEEMLTYKEISDDQTKKIEEVKVHCAAIIDILNTTSEEEGKEAGSLDDVRAAVNAVVTASMWSARALSN